MTLTFHSIGKSNLRGAMEPSGGLHDYLKMAVALIGTRPIRLANGTDLSSEHGTFQVWTNNNPLQVTAYSAGPNAIFWNDPTKDGPAGAVTYYSVQLEVSPSLYFAILVTLNAHDAQLSLELEVPDLDTVARGGAVRFEDLYARGMSRVSAFTLSVTRGGGAREPLLPETWPLALGPSGVVVF